MDIKEITTQELAEKLERGDNFKLVMTFHEWAFKAKHIPGSLNITSKESSVGLIESTDEIVVYCVSKLCKASLTACLMMQNGGFKNVRRYVGGLEEWEASGYKLEGEDINKTVEPDDNFMS